MFGPQLLVSLTSGPLLLQLPRNQAHTIGPVVLLVMSAARHHASTD